MLSSDVQCQILQELKRVSARLDAVEERVTGGQQGVGLLGHKDIKLNTFAKHKCCKKKSKKVVVTSESSSDESDVLDVSTLRS